MGRPKKEIDKDLVISLAKLQCTYDEMAAVIGCHRETLMNRFSTVIKEAWTAGKASLRRAQWKAALSGNVTMQIWLGKQYLGQRDEQYLKGSGEDGQFEVKVSIADGDNVTQMPGNRISEYIKI